MAHRYIKQVKANSAALAAALQSYGYKMVTDGTDNHLVLWDLRRNSISGSKVEALLEEISITVNKNTVHGDKSAVTPGMPLLSLLLIIVIVQVQWAHTL
jgi:glycine hydroxymethyltransferase